RLWEHREVSAGIGRRGNGPHVALVATARTGARVDSLTVHVPRLPELRVLDLYLIDARILLLVRFLLWAGRCLPNRRSVVVVPLALGEQEHVLVGLRRAVSDA